MTYSSFLHRCLRELSPGDPECAVDVTKLKMTLKLNSVRALSRGLGQRPTSLKI